MSRAIGFSAIAAFLAAFAPASDEKKQAESKPAKEWTPPKAGTFNALKARSIGPALMSGRIGDFAVNPNDSSEYYVAVCSGGVWKTTNAGITYKPVFDSQGSYSIGCVEIDPTNTNVVWVGGGENNSQRSVSFGDGVYRSADGGKSWKNMGLKESEHIGMIAVDPRDGNVVYVAAQGPLWRSGGDRGLYKTIDGGKHWERALHISDDTGVNEVHLDPRNPDVLYASSYQRRRRVWTLINGGPESAIYKSEDAGRTWRKLTSGIPGGDKGRIGMDISPANPDVIYAIVEATAGKGGVFRSSDRGESWERRSSYTTSSPQYYNEIICDPKNVDRVYFLDTFLAVSEDGGKSVGRIPIRNKHVDEHALWIDPQDTYHLLDGCDGGLYETFDRGQNWRFIPNLPVTQFYRVSVDNSKPFYYVYGGTQDNNSQGGPSRTTSRDGITNEDWFITVGGDGYESVIDPEDPMIVYAQWQYGGLVRHDRRSGEIVDIKPRERPDDKPYVWNWDSPVLISPHSHTRLYFAGNFLFRSDDRGDSWEMISGDLTRGLDRNQLKVMGKIQNVDAVSKNRSTSIYGNAVSLSESPVKEGVLYVGTDDGLVHVTKDGGENWRKISLFPGVPDRTYVSCLTASQHDADTVFASFDNHKDGDFKPYLLRSSDAGETWESIAGDLPERNIVYNIQQDHVDARILFCGTEFGAYFTLDGGKHWAKVAGLPTIAVRDIDIQRRENDVAFATFGRGFYILDDYSPLRQVRSDELKKDAYVFTVKDALRYIPRSRLGGGGGGSQGATRYRAPNPPFGAVFTYNVKESLQTKREKRKEAEKKMGENYKYPTMDELRAEDQEIAPSMLMVIRDEDGEVVKRLDASKSKGMHRMSWDLRVPSTTPISSGGGRRFGRGGQFALPGTYTATVAKQLGGEVTEISEPREFNVIPLELATFAAEDKEAVFAFFKKVSRLQRAAMGAARVASDVGNRIRLVRAAIKATPALDLDLIKQTHELQDRLNAINLAMSGDSTLRKQQAPTAPAVMQRIGQITAWGVTSPPTQTQHDGYKYAGEAFTKVLADLHSLVDDLKTLEDQLETAGAPWTPGRFPKWEMEEDE